MIPAKLATPGLFKIKTFKNKCYDVIIVDYNGINKILSRHPNYIVEVVLWPKFDKVKFGSTILDKISGKR